jgi:hypothetical protein
MTQPALGSFDDRAYSCAVQDERAARVAITSEQIKAARGLLRWEQKDLSEACGLALVTIKSIEQRPGPLMVRTSSLYAIVAAFDKAGVIFTEADNGGAGVKWKGKSR